MKDGKILKTSIVVIFLILSLVLISCRSNDVSPITSESEDIMVKDDKALESQEEETEELTKEEEEPVETVEEDVEMEKEEYDGLCSNPYFPVKPDFLWNYLVKCPSETYEYISSFYEITDYSFTEKMKSLVFNADMKWLCLPDGLVLSEYAALILEEDDQGMEFITESYDGITLPSSEKWIIGHKWDTIYKVRTTITDEGEQMTFTGDIIFKNEVVAIESVTVPAGTFPKAVKIDLDKSMNISVDIEGASMSFNTYTDISSWYVEDTGLVKQISQATCGTTTVELLSVEENI